MKTSEFEIKVGRFTSRRMRIDLLDATLMEQSCRKTHKEMWRLLSSGDPSINERLVYTLHEIRVRIQSPVRLEWQTRPLFSSDVFYRELVH
jgi:hypothetical protein